MDADTNGDGKIDYKGLCLFLCRKKKNNNIIEIILIESLENSVLTIPSVCLYHKICYNLGMRMYLCTPRRLCRTGCFLLSEIVLQAFRTLHKKTNRYQIQRTRHISGITFIGYVKNRQIGKSYNLNFGSNNTKGPKQDSQSQVRSHMPDGEEPV